MTTDQKREQDKANDAARKAANDATKKKSIGKGSANPGGKK